MKRKKLLLPTMILVVALIAMGVCSIINSVAKKPTVTEGEFAFSITYELDGETITIDDVYKARYDRNAGYTDTKSRIYTGKIEGIQEEGNTFYVLQEDADGSIVLNTKLYADHLMGDPMYDYFSNEVFEPQILYYDLEEIEYTDEETLSAQGVKLISWEYPAPIENSFVFSHISIFNSEITLWTLAISLVALLLTIIFVRKEKNLVRRPIDTVSTIFNVLIGVSAIPFFTILSYLMDATGDNEGIFNQVIYFISALTVLGIAASVSLRRKGYKKSALFVQFAGPVIFALILLLDTLA